MRRTIFVSCLLLFGFAFLSRALAQDEPKPADAAKAAEPAAHYYHLELVVQELGTDGKPTNSRSYTTTVSTGTREMASIRTSSKIPIVTSEGGSPSNIQYQYQNVGVNIDAQRAHEIGHELSLDLTADISTVADNDARLRVPIIRENRWQSVILIPIGKPTVVFTSDALDSKGSMQLVVTATLVQ